MKIILFLPNLNGGGAERMLTALCRHFMSMNHQVTFAIGQNAGEYSEQLKGLPLHVLGADRLIRCVFPLRRLLRDIQPHVILSTITETNIIASLAALGMGTRVILREANTPSIERLHVHGLNSKICHWLAPSRYRAADAVIAISDGVGKYLATTYRLDPKKLHVIPNPAYDPALVMRAEMACSHPWLEKNRRHQTIVSMGRLVEQKDYPTGLRALARIRRSRDVRWIILGEGPKREALTTFIRELHLDDAVELIGFDSNPHRFLARADALMLSSAWEGFGNVVVEALACGIPVAATDCPHGPGEILDWGRFGHLAPVGDDAQLAISLESALQDYDRDRLRMRALDYAMPRIGDMYLNICKG